MTSSPHFVAQKGRTPEIVSHGQTYFAVCVCMHCRVYGVLHNHVRCASTGELHNNIRMTWGKAILPWSPDPDMAIKRTVYLNHKYALDGCDPCSYSGILWCYGKTLSSILAASLADNELWSAVCAACAFCICQTVAAACVMFADTSASILAAIVAYAAVVCVRGSASLTR